MAIINSQIKAGPKYYREYVNNSGTLDRVENLPDLSNISDLSDFCFYYYNNYKSLTNTAISLVLPAIITGRSAVSWVYAYSNITSFIVSGIKKVAANYTLTSFTQGCDYLTTASLPDLEIVDGEYGLSAIVSTCPIITSLLLPRLHTIKQKSAMQRFVYNTTNLTSLSFPSLKTIDGDTVFNYSYDNTGITNLYFPALTTSSFGSTYTTQFQNMFTSNSSICTLHFPKNLSGTSTITALTGYPNFGRSGTSIVYDQPSTLILTCANSVVYERSPKDDTGSSLAWRKNQYDADGFVVDWTPFYTSTLNDPQVGDTIYSDAACTTAVTTISSIA